MTLALFDTGVVLDGVSIPVNVQHTIHMDMKLETCTCCFTVKQQCILSCLSQGSHKPGLYNLNVRGADYHHNVVQFLDPCDSV